MRHILTRLRSSSLSGLILIRAGRTEVEHWAQLLFAWTSYLGSTLFHSVVAAAAVCYIKFHISILTWFHSWYLCVSSSQFTNWRVAFVYNSYSFCRRRRVSISHSRHSSLRSSTLPPGRPPLVCIRLIKILQFGGFWEWRIYGRHLNLRVFMERWIPWKGEGRGRETQSASEGRWQNVVFLRQEDLYICVHYEQLTFSFKFRHNWANDSDSGWLKDDTLGKQDREDDDELWDENLCDFNGKIGIGGGGREWKLPRHGCTPTSTIYLTRSLGAEQKASYSHLHLTRRRKD